MQVIRLLFRRGPTASEYSVRLNALLSLLLQYIHLCNQVCDLIAREDEGAYVQKLHAWEAAYPPFFRAWRHFFNHPPKDKALFAFHQLVLRMATSLADESFAMVEMAGAANIGDRRTAISLRSKLDSLWYDIEIRAARLQALFTELSDKHPDLLQELHIPPWIVDPHGECD